MRGRRGFIFMVLVTVIFAAMPACAEEAVQGVPESAADLKNIMTDAGKNIRKAEAALDKEEKCLQKQARIDKCRAEAEARRAAGAAARQARIDARNEALARHNAALAQRKADFELKKANREIDIAQHKLKKAKIDSIYKSMKNYYATGQYDLATLACQDILTLDKDNPVAKQYLVKICDRIHKEEFTSIAKDKERARDEKITLSH